MKFFAIFTVLVIFVVSVTSNNPAPKVMSEQCDLDPRCPQDESTESKTTYIGHESDCAKYYIVSF